MTFRRRKKSDVSQAFKKDRQLQQFVLTDVTPTGKVLGTGSFGSVEEVLYKQLICAGKKLHDSLIDVQNEGLAEVVQRYMQECHLMSSLRHPNITLFLGLCFLPESQLPLLIMEKLETSLDDLLEGMKNLPLSLKRSILEDVARGLLYLHDRKPPVIHRDLTSRNVLLTSSLVAKITDMGNSRILNIKPGQMVKNMTKYPGTLVYMPPEVQDDSHQYGGSMDIFSFGHLSLYTITQKFPGDLLPSTYLNNRDVRARSEIERRQQYLDQLESQINALHPSLVDLVKQCLLNDPRDRPSTIELLTKLQKLRVEIEGEYGGPIKLDMVRMKLAKEVKEKDKRVEELEMKLEERTQELTQMTTQEAELKKYVREMTTQLKLYKEDVEELEAEIKTRDEQIAAKEALIVKKDEEIAAKEALIVKKDGEIAAKETLLQKYSDKRQLRSVSFSKQECENIDRHKIQYIRNLETGQFGEIWEGLWKGSDHVTVKTLKPGCDMTVENFLEEAKLIKRLSHPKVIKLIGVCTQEEPIYIVTELLKPGCLVDYLREASWSLKEAMLIDIGAQIAKGMAYLESKNCIHRDLTARNVLISDNRICKIANFHLARILSQNTYQDQPGACKFPIKWTAPEALQHRQFTIKCDVWSFGILLFEVITFGRIPYPGIQNKYVVEKIKGGYRMPKPQDCPSGLYDIMLECWKMDPESRPTFESLHWHLEEFYTATELGYTEPSGVYANINVHANIDTD